VKVDAGCSRILALLADQLAAPAAPKGARCATNR
jgi:hypothetical protein